jgi:hypothetical protein
VPDSTLREDIQAEIDEPGQVTKDELRAVLKRHPEPPPSAPDQGDFDDTDFDPADFG